MRNILQKFNGIELTSWFFNFVISAFVLRMAIPGMIYIFIPLWIVFLIVNIRSLSFIGMLNASRKYFLYIIVCILYFIPFVVQFEFTSVLVSDIFHMLVIISFIFFWEERKEEIDINKFLQILGFTWVSLLVPVAILGLLNFAGFITISSAYHSTSLMSDVNFFSLAYLIGLYIVLKVKVHFRYSIPLKALLSIIFSLVVLFSGSRRGLIFLFILYAYIFYISLRGNNFKVFIGVLIGLIFISALSFNKLKIAYFLSENTLENISQLAYRYYNMINPNANYEIFSDKLKMNNVRYVSKLNDNLIANGDFEFDMLYWTHNAKGLRVAIVETPYGKGIKLSKDDALPGLWSLLYRGRRIYFHGAHQYELEYKCKPVIGDVNSIMAGFALGENTKDINGIRSFDLKKNIDTLTEESWYQINCEYEFIKDEKNCLGFFNYQLPNTQLIISDVKLKRTNNSKQVVNYVLDTLSFSQNETLEWDGNGRLTRYALAYEFFKNQTFFKKFFGSGFDYLEFYKKKLGKIDYPHNPIISSFLYSGIIGGVVYVIFIIWVIISYLKLRSKNEILYFPFIMVFVFSIISGNSHFSVPVFLFLSIVPSLFDKEEIKYFNKNEY